VTNNSKASEWHYEKSPEEIIDALRRQLANMRRSFAAFDEGFEEEAERIASSVYIICQDSGRNNKSLLNQLCFKDHIKIPETCLRFKPEPGVVRGDPPLTACMIKEDGTITYVPPLGSSKQILSTPRVAFSRWWEHGVYQSRRTGLMLSRKNLVFGLRSQDGGAHVDSSLKSEAYYRFSRLGDHVSWNTEKTLSVFSLSNGGVPVTNGHLVSMRQIGWELDQALISKGF
jgi:hypothetical protein